MSVSINSITGIENVIQPADNASITSNQAMIAREYRATQLFMKLAKSTGNKMAVNVLNEIADENQVHVSESLKLLRELACEEEKLLININFKPVEITDKKP